MDSSALDLQIGNVEGEVKVAVSGYNRDWLPCVSGFSGTLNQYKCAVEMKSEAGL